MRPASCTLVGAGPVGTLLALLLARRGQSVRVLERRADPRTTPPQGGRSINLALAARGMVALERAGLGSLVSAHSVVMRGRMLHDETGRVSFIPYGQRQHEVLHAIGRTELNRVLTTAAAAHPGIDLHFGQRCIDVDPVRQTLQWRTGDDGPSHSETFQTLLATDGAGSAVRGALAARGLVQVTEEALPHDYKEFLICAGAAGPVFEPHALHIWPRGHFMLIALPNADGSFTATLFMPRRGTPSFQSLDAQGAVSAFFAAQFPDAAAVLPDLEQQYARHPQSRLATVHCRPWHDRHVLLLGDAAHAIVPFHGQGLNCGFEDCVALDDLLDAAPDLGPAGFARLFAAFQAQRRPDTDAIAAMALENYLEMRDTVRSADFARRQALALQLEQMFPRRFIPRYAMVTFHPEISYAAARDRGARQERVLDQLLRQPAPADAALDAATAARLLEQAGL